MRYERVKVTRDQHTIHNHAVPPWEVPVLEFIFDDGNVVRLDEFVQVDREYPDALKELDRLVRAYGSDPQSGVPYANAVFGNQRQGAKALQKLIDDARVEDEAAAKEKAPAPVLARKRDRPAQVDSLLG